MLYVSHFLEDDKQEVIENRLKIFNGELEQLKEYYSSNGKFFSVNGEDKIEKVTESLLAIIGEQG